MFISWNGNEKLWNENLSGCNAFLYVALMFV